MTSALSWTDSLRLNQPLIDRTHEEFVDLLAQVSVALDGADLPAALAAFERLADHTVGHFGQEDRWLRATGFAEGNCHTRQHATVLALMREVVRRARDEADWEPLRLVAAELGPWFVQHAAMMDAGLVQQMATLGFDPVSGETARPLPEVELTHCGGSGCA